MLCPECFTSWELAEDFVQHIQAHGLDPWKCREILKYLKVQKIEPHKVFTEPCNCRAWGARYECELRIYRAR